MFTSNSKDLTAAPAFLALSCVGFLASAPAMAADDASAGADRGADSIFVNGQYQQEPIAPKATAPLLDTPRSIAVISKEVIKDTGSATLVEALRTVPGITFGAAEGGNPMGDRPFIRGFDSQGSTFVDGVRDPSAQSREVFAVEQIQIVRGSDSTLGGRGSAGGSLNIVSKLPLAETFAAGAVSVGNADYKRATADINYRFNDIAFRINGMWHDQGVAGRDAIWQKRWGIAPSVTIGVDGPTQLTLAYYHLETDELPDSGFPYFYTIGNAPGGETLSEPAIGDVTTIGGVTGHVDRDNFYGLKSRDFRKTKTNQATMRFQHDFGGIILRNTSRYSRNSQSYILSQPDDSKGNVFGTDSSVPTTAGGLVWRRANSRYGYVESITNQTDLYGKLNTGAVEHSFAVGAEFSWEKARRGSFVFSDGTGSCTDTDLSRFYCTSLFNPNPSDPWVNYESDTSDILADIIRTSTPQQIQNDARTRSIYAFDSITLTPWLIANLGIRYDSFKTTLTPAIAAPATSAQRFSRTDDLVNWQAGLVFKPTPNTSIYASYATSATPPNSLIGEGSESNGLTPGRGEPISTMIDDLKVEKTKSYEIGAKADLFDDHLSLTFAAFHTETKNARAIGSNGTVDYIGSRKVKGIELGFNGSILPGWSIFGGYTYLDAEITDGGFSSLAVAANGAAPATTILVPSANTGRPFPQTAKHSFTVWTDYHVTPAISIGGGAFYMSRIYGGFQDNRTATQDASGVVTVNPATKVVARSVPSYWRFDARVGYKINDHFDIAVNAQNLTNKVYFNQAYTSHYAGIAPGRTVFATLNFKY